MHRTKLPGTNYTPYQTQWRPHGTLAEFGPRWQQQRRNRSGNKYINKTNDTLSSNEDYWCETCDRGFHTSQLLDNHKQQHQRCNIDGCQFIAHPKVITKHIQMQHSTGLFQKISKLNNPEEIEKWREERKKRYPTKENIEKKGAEMKEKIERGEKMGMKYKRQINPYHREQGTKRKYNDNSHRRNLKSRHQANILSTDINKCKPSVKEIKKPPLVQRDNKQIHKVDESRTLKPFSGILNLLDDTDNDNNIDELHCNFAIEDDEYALDEPTHVKVSASEEPVVCEALSTLMCSYESSDNETIHETKTKCNKSEIFNKLPITVDFKNKYVDPNDDDSGPEETVILKVPVVESNSDLFSNNNKTHKNSNIANHTRAEKKIHSPGVHKRNSTIKLKSKLPSTLLEKLLHNEIRQERNIVLQCIRHIVKNNYFDKSI